MKYFYIILTLSLLLSSCSIYTSLNELNESTETHPSIYKAIFKEVNFIKYWEFNKKSKKKILIEELYSFKLIYDNEKTIIKAIGNKEHYKMFLEKDLQRCIDKNNFFNDKKTQSIHLKIVIIGNQHQGKYIPLRKFKVKDKEEEIYYMRIHLYPHHHD